MKKGIAAILLCMQIIYSGSVYAIPKNVRQAGIVDILDDLTKTYSTGNVVCSNGAKASETPAYIIYRTYSDITEFYISISEGEESSAFKVYTSNDNVSYTHVSAVRTSGEVEYNNTKQTVYEFADLNAGQKYVKIEFLDEQVTLNSAFINVDFGDPQLMSLFKKASSGSSGNSSAQREVTVEQMLLYKDRFIQRNLTGTPNISAYIDTINEDGTWSDVNYSGESGALTYTHAERIEAMAKVVSNKSSPLYNDEGLLEKLANVLDYWVNTNIIFTAWYDNEIRVPRHIGNTLLVAGKMLPPATEQRAIEYLLEKISVREPFDKRTGANLIATQTNRIRYALCTNDVERIKSAFDRIAEEITVVNKLDDETNAWRNRLFDGYVNLPHLPDTREGIQVDYSSLFHGPLIYSGSYGLSYVTEISRILADTQQTNLFSRDGIEDLVDHILEHYRWITRGSTMDYSVIGRSIARKSSAVSSGNASGLLQAVRILSQIPDMYKGDELADYYRASMNKKSGQNSALVEHTIYSAVASDEPEAENIAINTIDKSLDTRWSSNNSGDTIAFDLNKVESVGAVGIAFFSGNIRKTNFALELSEDNVAWERVFEGQSSGATSNLEYYALDDARKVRYVRLVCDGNTINEWNSIAEVAVFDAIDVEKSAEEGIAFELISEADDIKVYVATVASVVLENAITGNRFFWKADYTTHQQPNYLATIRTSSNRTIASEAVNTENLKGDYLADGCTYIYRDGTEYDDIFGAWDWHKIPGTTTQLQPFEPITIQHKAIRGSNSDYSGGVTDGKFGATAMELVRDGLSAKKAWFMFEDEFVALGTDIRTNSGYKYITTANQSLLKGDVTVGNGSGTRVLPMGAHSNQQANWVHHDNIGYVFFDTENISIGNQSVTADRVDISWGGVYSRPNKSDMITRDIFSLWFDHTPSTAKKSYEYIVVPEIKSIELAAYAANKPVRVISNTPQLQAVEHTGLEVAQGVFWGPGNMTVLDNLRISVDKSVILQAEQKENKLTLAVASSAAKSEPVQITVNKSLTGSGATASGDGSSIINIQLPRGEYAGKSIVLEFEL
ncbi:MAG: discoidin domain-containing protein [Firmicutes bacterium]|nr:discoidin domain-containing protein [Bacillota bacterium]